MEIFLYCRVLEIKQIEIIYHQLIAIREETPQATEKISTTYDSSVWENYNKIVDNLSSAADKDYSRFKMTPRSNHVGQGQRFYWIEISTFRQILGSLISTLHVEFFSDKSDPYEKSSHPFINQSFSQSTNIEILMHTVLQINEQLVKKEDHYLAGSTERKFIDKVKEVLSGVKSVNEALLLIFQLASSFKLPIEKLIEIFK
jgi:hypothetical protein